MDHFLKELNLAGTWTYQFDHKDIGVNDKWYSMDLGEGEFNVPGTTATNQIGEQVCYQESESITKEDVKFPQPKWRYQGTIWLQTNFYLPDDWSIESTNLIFERVLGQSELWINDNYCGKKEHLSVAHHYLIEAKQLNFGQENRLTVRLNNENHYHLGELASGFSEHTQTLWLGIVGDCLIWQSNLDHDYFTLYPSYKKKHLLVRQRSNYKYEFKIFDDENKSLNYQLNRTESKTGESLLRFILLDNDLYPWNEHQPKLYRLEISNGIDVISKSFGLLDLETDNKKIYLNGNPIFLRGTLDCAIFPKTGYPPTDIEFWKKTFSTIQQYGLNHVRFHSWCPPKAAFIVADQLGLYLMVEGPFWLDSWFDNVVGSYSGHYPFIEKEVKAILTTYGHHPSFCFFAIGNELAGDFPFLAELIGKLPFTEQQILTTITANTTNKKRTFYREADDFFIGVEYQKLGLRGNRFLDQMVETLNLNYQPATKAVPVPVVTHEIGQYASYPDLNSITKYDGTILPYNLLAIKSDLEKKQLHDKAVAFLQASGKLASDLYKAEIEAVVRTEGISGYQLLGLQDYSGQNTATVGLLDSFWESKGFVSPEWFKQFSSPIVPMIESDKRIFNINEKEIIKLAVRHNGSQDYQEAEFNLILRCEDKEIIVKKVKCPVKTGDYQQLDKAEIDFSLLFPLRKYLEQATLTLEMRVNDEYVCSNSWDIWLYQERESPSTPNFIHDSWLSPRLVSALERGENCLLTPDPEIVKDSETGNFFPVFWSPVFFESKDSCGMIVDDKHPLFNHFATKDYSTLQWKNLLEYSINFELESIRSLITIVPNFYNHAYRTPLFEVKVGKGNLICCGLELDRNQTPEQLAFKHALYHYIQSPDFNPKQELSLSKLTALFTKSKLIEPSITRNDLAYRKPAWSDQEKSKRHGAFKGNDGNRLTYWSAPSQTDGHWWCVDLGASYPIAEIIVEPLNADVTSFVIELSEDKQNWYYFAKSTHFFDQHILSGASSGRYVKISYQHPLNSDAGQYSCQVFSE